MAFPTRSLTREGGFLMEPRREKNEPKTPQIRREEQRSKLQIVKLEARIAPAITLNHNEALVRDPAQAKPKAPQPRKGDTRGRFRLVKLEARIAPGLSPNHNETLVHDCAARAR